MAVYVSSYIYCIGFWVYSFQQAFGLLKSWVRASLSRLLAVIKLCMYGPIQRGSYSFLEINSTHVNLQYF